MTKRLLTPLIAPVAMGLLFASCLVGVDRLAFRDVSHFYTPLYDYVAARHGDQWLPLWNPLDQTGIPLLGETTTAVLYPIRYVVFSLPISSEVAISWYIVLHLMLASINATIAARWSGVSDPASSLAGIIYALSGSVLFLYCNPPFLVGAAWLPLVVGSALARRPMSTAKVILVGGTSMSLMILGGDPQTALHAMIVIAIAWLGLIIARRPWRVDRRVVIGVPLLAGLLAAPQLAASISWSVQSERMDRQVSDRWYDPPIVGSRRHQSYEFSLPPWHYVELATPNAYGSLFPINQRLSQSLPGDGRMWTPTIYMGMLAAIAWLIQIKSRCWDRWTVIALVAALLSMGHFGAVWFFQAITGAGTSIDSAIGGPYWALYTFMPGYDSLRYPAKWLPMFALGTSLLTARVIDQQSDWRLIGRTAIVIAFVAAVLWILVLMGGEWIALASDQKLQDEFWGPLEFGPALRQVRWSLVHSAVICLMIAWLCGVRKTATWSRSAVQYGLLFVLLMDLGVSGRNLVSKVNRSDERDAMATNAIPEGTRWLATRTDAGWPSQWALSSEAQRVSDVEASTRLAWFGRWHLAKRVNVVNNMVSIRSRTMAQFWQATRRMANDRPGRQAERLFIGIRRWLSIGGVVHRTSQTDFVRINARTARLARVKFSIEQTEPSLRAYDAWIANATRQPTPRDLDGLLSRILQTDGDPKPLVSRHEDLTIQRTREVTGIAEIDTVASHGDQEEYVVRLPGRMLLARPVYQDGHWKARYAPLSTTSTGEDEWRSTRVSQVDFLKQGIVLPAGEWKLRFVYSPWWLTWTLRIAAIAWCGVVIGAIVTVRRPVLARPKATARP